MRSVAHLSSGWQLHPFPSQQRLPLHPSAHPTTREVSLWNLNFRIYYDMKQRAAMSEKATSYTLLQCLQDWWLNLCSSNSTKELPIKASPTTTDFTPKLRAWTCRTWEKQKSCFSLPIPHCLPKTKNNIEDNLKTPATESNHSCVGLGADFKSLIITMTRTREYQYRLWANAAALC